VRIAQFKTDGSGYVNISSEVAGETCVTYSGWVRISEYAEVEFTSLPPAVVVEGQLKQLDAAEQELREKFQQKLNELAEARAKLLSLSHQPDMPDVMP
jgi:hypothetical protein